MALEDDATCPACTGLKWAPGPRCLHRFHYDTCGYAHKDPATLAGPTHPRCVDCRHFAPYDDRFKTGQCRVAAPIVNDKIGIMPSAAAVWPIVHESWWCGRFESLAVPVAPEKLTQPSQPPFSEFCTVCGEIMNTDAGMTPGSAGSLCCPLLGFRWHREAARDINKQNKLLHEAYNVGKFVGQHPPR